MKQISRREPTPNRMMEGCETVGQSQSRCESGLHSQRPLTPDEQRTLVKLFKIAESNGYFDPVQTGQT